RQRQFGGLLVINLNRNAGSGADVADLINALRGVSRHRLIAATDQEGGAICLGVSSVPCAPMPVGNAETTRMAQALRGLGFDLDPGPVSVHDVPAPVGPWLQWRDPRRRYGDGRDRRQHADS